MDVFIETERLVIRELLPADAEGMYEMDADPEVHKYVGKKPVTTIEQTRGVIDFIRQQYVDNGIGRWAIMEKSTNNFVGWTGFKFIQGPVNKHSNFYDFGYRLARKHWGKGYGTESAIAALQYGVDQLKFKDIYAETDVNNAASRRILEKLGFLYIETFNYDGDPNWQKVGEPTTWYKWVGAHKT